MRTRRQCDKRPKLPLRIVSEGPHGGKLMFRFLQCSSQLQILRVLSKDKNGSDLRARFRPYRRVLKQSWKLRSLYDVQHLDFD